MTTKQLLDKMVAEDTCEHGLICPSCALLQREAKKLRQAMRFNKRVQNLTGIDPLAKIVE